ncbi:MAG: response regulator, partial [Bdellovibrionales bacterium]
MRSNKDYKLLVVDDEEAICKLVQGLLQDEGYHVDYALNVNSACKKFDEGAFDLCILDVW